MILVKRNPWKWKSPKSNLYCRKIYYFNKQRKGKGLKMLTSKQMLQRLEIAITKVKAGNLSKNLVNEVQKTIYIFLPSK